MKLKFYLVLFSAILAIAATSCAPPQESQTKRPKASPTPSENMNGMAGMEGMNERGDKVMGFDHMKTTHHFRLFPTGGAVEVEANDASDTASRDQIRQHLSHIAQMFASGNFNAPMLIHGRTPSGVPTMEKLKGDIKYQFEDTEKGGRVRISTSNPEALAAIHEFLRFQIQDHQTGDPTEIAQQP